MLSNLFIRNFVLVKESEITFDSGCTVLTGETGAGKSIIFDALGLALGNRAENRLIRHGEEQAEIVASFTELTTEITEWLQEQEISFDNTNGSTELILRRVIRRDGRSRAFINATPTTIQSLRELAKMLIDIQGQHAHQRLLQRNEQLRLLDSYADNSIQLTEMESNYTNWNILLQQQNALRKSESERKDRVELLNFQLQELEQLGLRDGEIAELEEEQKLLSGGEQLIEHGDNAFKLLNGDSEEQSSVQQLYRAVAQLESLEQIDPETKSLRENLLEVTLQAEEIGNELRDHIANYTLDPERLQWLNERLTTISDLARKHLCSSSELLQRQRKMESERGKLQSTDQQLEKIAQEIKSAEKSCYKVAEKLHKRRSAAAIKLEAEVSAEIKTLGMEEGELRITVNTVTENGFRSTGTDEVNFIVRTNRGDEFHPLAKSASGGELSRISLAIQIASANQGETPTLIFDEVDSGVGGAIAEMVGEKLRRLGEKTQILCVTHLPQVASQGHHHFKIDKQSEGDETISAITSLNTTQRVDEIARMLGGVSITKQSRAHAQEMLV